MTGMEGGEAEVIQHVEIGTGGFQRAGEEDLSLVELFYGCQGDAGRKVQAGVASGGLGKAEQDGLGVGFAAGEIKALQAQQDHGRGFAHIGRKAIQ